MLEFLFELFIDTLARFSAVWNVLSTNVLDVIWYGNTSWGFASIEQWISKEQFYEIFSWLDMSFLVLVLGGGLVALLVWKLITVILDILPT